MKRRWRLRFSTKNRMNWIHGFLANWFCIMWIKYFTITPTVEDLVCTGEGEKCISSALKTEGKLWHRPPCQELTVHAQAPSVDCTECRATSSDFSELPGIDISGPHDDKKNVFLLFFWNVRTQDRAILKTKSSWMCKDWWQCYHYIEKVCTGESLPVVQTSYLSQK